MNAVIFCLPVIVAIILLIFYRKKVTYWEYALLIVPSMLIAVFMEVVMKSFNANDTEYLGYHMTKVTHYERWNEYIHRTCEREVEIGRDGDGKPIYKKEEYDCSYVEDHPERWTYTLNNGEEEYMSESNFNRVRKKFGTKYEFRDMHRRYHTIDGDAYEYRWPGDFNRIEAVTESHDYENRLKASKTIFKMEHISKKKARKLGLFDYPEITDEYVQNCVLGLDLPDTEKLWINNINALYGKEKQIRLYMLFFKNRGVDVFQKQRSYWQNGNKNEVVLCVGIDSLTNKVNWCEGFSWSDIPLIENRAKQYFLDHPHINLKEFNEYIVPYIQVEWSRRSFADFSYINIELSLAQYIWILVITILYNIGISIYIVKNEFDADCA